MRVCFALPGLHRVDRGAEVAIESVANLLAARADCEVTVFGSGPERKERRYRYARVPCAPRERFEGWPRLPLLRDECAWEELSFAWNLRRIYRPLDFDLTVTCGYPYLNWLLRSGRREARPAHVFLTQNGDWPARTRRREYRFFSCDGLVCVNPEHEARNRTRWRCALIPNGVDLQRFRAGPARRDELGLPPGARVVLMVSALIPTKRVLAGIRAVARLPEHVLVVAGDGPLRAQADSLGAELLPGRYRRLVCARDEMPGIYRSADVLLHLSEDESFGIAYLEALACGLPIVAPESPVARWLLEDHATFVAGADETSVAAALTAALGGSGPEHAASRRAFVERRYAWTAIASQYHEFLHAVHERTRESPSSAQLPARETTALLERPR